MLPARRCSQEGKRVAGAAAGAFVGPTPLRSGGVCSSMSVPMQRLVPRSEAAMEAARGRSQAAACGVSGCASTVECSARMPRQAFIVWQCACHESSNVCLKLLKRYALSWTWFKPGRRLRLVWWVMTSHLESRLPPGAAGCAVHATSVCAPPPRARCGRRVFCASSMTVCEEHRHRRDASMTVFAKDRHRHDFSMTVFTDDGLQ